VALWQFCGGHRGTVTVLLLALLLFFPFQCHSTIAPVSTAGTKGRSGEAWEPSEPKSCLFPTNQCGVTKYSTSIPFYPFICSRQATEESLRPMAVDSIRNVQHLLMFPFIYS
jgi:hypothetical protein